MKSNEADAAGAEEMERMRQEPSKMERMQQVQSTLGKCKRTRIKERCGERSFDLVIFI
jgi:hypothetical protein